MDLPNLLRSSRTSAIHRAWLNTLLPWLIPFNQPHGFRVKPMVSGGIEVRIPYWRVNRNHIKGIHACAMATAAEFCSGLALLEHIDAKKYRLIMSSLYIHYHYQGKRTSYARCSPTAVMIDEQVIKPLALQEAVLYTSEVRIEDKSGQHLATGRITWQVKEWGRVRTKV